MHVTMFYTFGSDHSVEGVNMQDKYVSVVAAEGTDHRAVFMAWLGSNEFAGEYSEKEFERYLGKYAPAHFRSIRID